MVCKERPNVSSLLTRCTNCSWAFVSVRWATVPRAWWRKGGGGGESKGRGWGEGERGEMEEMEGRRRERKNRGNGGEKKNKVKRELNLLPSTL